MLRYGSYQSRLPIASAYRRDTFSGNLFILRTKEGDLTLQINMIKNLMIDDMKLKTKAKLSLQAEILNELEDINDAQVDLVVGVPNFRFKNVISPFSLEAVLRNALNRAAPQLMGQFDSNRFSNAMFTQRSSEHRSSNRSESRPAESVMPSLPNELTAAGRQDLFVYHIKDLSLRKRARAGVPIFDTEVPYHDIYTIDYSFFSKTTCRGSQAHTDCNQRLQCALRRRFLSCTSSRQQSQTWNSRDIMESGE